MSSLTQTVLNGVEMTPAEDLCLAILRDSLDVSIQTLISQHQTYPFVLLRSAGSWGTWGGDDRFIDTVTLMVHTFAEGINADEDAALLAEAVRTTLRDAVNKVYPGLGYLTKVKLQDRPKRVTDWASSVGPVQYADLPTGVQRWETSYLLTIRKPATKPYAS